MRSPTPPRWPPPSSTPAPSPGSGDGPSPNTAPTADALYTPFKEPSTSSSRSAAPGEPGERYECDHDLLHGSPGYPSTLSSQATASRCVPPGTIAPRAL